ncbi:MAG: deoxyguanosinetriphosphate triphosphohydrolase [Coriobacteriales bacterium]|jgi:dGTPase|nr:deoxyguanosinetriphosphate triphosphohydrolase [Coriobacteriales bacterium]
MITREQREAAEHQRLSAHAAFASAATRQGTPDRDPLRTAFQRDRDRILHSKAFRRLMHKTQVFVAPEGDHYRTRLTHTLEVAQISRAIAQALALNEDLTEAIALGHDLGHTPFGHTGEGALSLALARYHGLNPAEHPNLYRHNLQSLRVVDVLENDGRGLNLTNEVRDGILHHTGSERAATLEGRIVATADRIAYVNHDIDDALRAGIIVESDLPLSTHTLLGNSHSERITTLVSDMITTSDGTGDIQMSERIWDAMIELRRFLHENVYVRADNRTEEPKALELVAALFKHYVENPGEIPPELRAASDDRVEVAATDYVASMTDRYATATFERLFVPEAWHRR